MATWETFAQHNQTDLVGLFTYPANTYAGFIPLVLTSLFVIVMFATYFSQRRLAGRGDFIASFAVAGFFNVVIAYIMSLTDGLIDGLTLTVSIGISIIGVILLFTTKDRI